MDKVSIKPEEPRFRKHKHNNIRFSQRSYCGIEGGISRSSLAEVPIPFSEKHIEGNPEKVSGRIADGTA